MNIFNLYVVIDQNFYLKPETPRVCLLTSCKYKVAASTFWTFFCTHSRISVTERQRLQPSSSHWTGGVAGLISPSSCSALHLPTYHMAPADLSLAWTPPPPPPSSASHLRMPTLIHRMRQRISQVTPKRHKWHFGDTTLLCSTFFGTWSRATKKNGCVLSWSTTSWNCQTPRWIVGFRTEAFFIFPLLSVTKSDSSVLVYGDNGPKTGNMRVDLGRLFRRGNA